MDLYILLNALLIIHLAGLIMGFIGGRAHGVIVSRIAGAPDATVEMLWEFEKKASWTAFIGTGLLVLSGTLMLWLKYGGTDGQDWLFWAKMILVAAVAAAEILRHQTALKWRAGIGTGERQTKLWGKFSGVAAVLTVIVAVFNFN